MHVNSILAVVTMFQNDLKLYNSFVLFFFKQTPKVCKDQLFQKFKMCTSPRMDFICNKVQLLSQWFTMPYHIDRSSTHQISQLLLLVHKLVWRWWPVNSRNRRRREALKNNGPYNDKSLCVYERKELYL